MEQASEKSQDATPHRREQAREQGQVARSQDLGSAMLLVGGLVTIYWLSESIVDFFGRLAIEQLGGAAWLSADADFIAHKWYGILGVMATVFLPLLLTVMAIGVISSVMQVGLMFLPDKLMPDFTRIDPIAGFGRVFSLVGVVRLTMGIFKIIIVAAVAYTSLRNEHETILSLAELSLVQIARYLLESLYWVMLKIGLALLLLAVLDYAFQWWKQEQDLRMTMQELRDEMKNMQGDPQMIGRRRAVQRQLVMQRLKGAVPKADVVITNPTELAIAIQYDPKTMKAPIVVAKGAGVLAQQIRRLALELGIPIVEKKPLAQTLYKEVDLNKAIPAQLYAAVAEVLAYVYQLKGKKLDMGK